MAERDPNQPPLLPLDELVGKLGELTGGQDPSTVRLALLHALVANMEAAPDMDPALLDEIWWIKDSVEKSNQPAEAAEAPPVEPLPAEVAAGAAVGATVTSDSAEVTAGPALEPVPEVVAITPTATAITAEQTTEPAETVESIEDFQPSPEFDPEDKIVVASGNDRMLDPYQGDAGVKLMYVDPKDTRHSREGVFKKVGRGFGELPEEARPSIRIRQLLDFRQFSRTGLLPPNIADFGFRATSSADPGESIKQAAHRFYDDYYERHGLRRDTSRDMGPALVKIDGWTVMALGVDINSGRGMFSFAVQGDVSYGEMVARAAAAYPAVFQQIPPTSLPREARVVTVPTVPSEAASPTAATEPTTATEEQPTGVESAADFRPSPEFDPASEPMVGTYYNRGGVDPVRYDPTATEKAWRLKGYDARDVPEELRMPGRVYDLMHRGREFGRTGAIPEDFSSLGAFYDELYDRLGLTVQATVAEFGSTVVKLDGWTLLSLGIDAAHDGRGSFAFALKGDVSYGEMLARARAAFPEAFNKIPEKSVAPEARVVIVPPEETAV